MTGFPRRLCLALFPVFLLFAVSPAPARCCPFCGMQGQTLTQEVDQAVLVLYGKLKNAVPGNPDGGGQTDMELDPAVGVIKDNAWLKGRKVIIIPKYVPTDKNDPAKFLLFLY